MIRISIVIPTYNEAKNLEPLAEEIFNSIDRSAIDLELIFVDDNSPDGTGAVAEKLKEKYPVQVIHRAGKLGLGSAVIEGFKLSDRPYLGVMDADLSHDPIILDELIKSLERHDITMGSRFAAGSTVEKWAWWRRALSETGVFLTRLLTGVKDPLAGYFFFNRKVIEGVKLNTVGYKILLEILIKGNYQSVKELPYNFRIRKFSTSKLNKMEYYLFLKQLVIYSGLKLVKKIDDNRGLVLLFAAVFALLLIGVTSRTLWMDETAIFWYWHYSPWQYLAEYFRVPDNHAPLYYFLELITYGIFPFGVLGIRLLSIICGVILSWLAYQLTRRYLKQSWAMFSVVIMMLSSYFILISQMARYHALAAVLTLAALLFFQRFMFDGRKQRDLSWFAVLAALVGWTDYPHFFYLILATNGYFLFRLIKDKTFYPWLKWLKAQIVIGLTFLPMVWLIWHRVFVQGDNGFSAIDLLGRSLMSHAMNFAMHFYAYFFGENLLPWNYLPFAIGLTVLIALGYFFVRQALERRWTAAELFVPIMALAFILLNTVILNILDPRYNFIVYPKYAFAAYPLFVVTLVLILSKIADRRWRLWLIAGLIIMELCGLYNFYTRQNYLNASYFNDFSGLEFIRDYSWPGDYFIISGDMNSGAFEFYEPQYFKKVAPLEASAVPAIASAEPGQRFWFIATASDDSNVNNEAVSKIPAGLHIVQHFDTVPLDPTLKTLKEKILGRGSYAYKYSVFLLSN